MTILLVKRMILLLRVRIMIIANLVNGNPIVMISINRRVTTIRKTSIRRIIPIVMNLAMVILSLVTITTDGE